MKFIVLVSKFMTYQKTKLKPSTLKTKQSIIDSLILPYFIDKESDSIEVDFIEKWRNDLESNNKIKPVTKNVAISVLKNLLFYATRVNNLTIDNYNKLLFVLEPIKDNVVVDDDEDFKASNFITKQQLDQIVSLLEKKNIASKDLYIFITKVLFYTGMRKSELRGLKVKRINLNDKSISIVSQKLNSNVSKDNVTLKSSNSKRTILLDDNTFNLIKDYITKNNLKSEDYLVPDVFGSYAYVLENVAKQIGLDRLTPHGLRHSHCSYLIQLYLDNNMVPDFGSIARRLGHNVENTMNVYYHLYPQQQKVLIDLLNK